MIIQAFGHNFRPFGSEERICNACGYVTWHTETVEETEKAIVQISGQRVFCGGAWHVLKYENA